jgi:Holliday junction resolvase
MIRDKQSHLSRARASIMSDLLAKKNRKIYVVEVKANSGKQNLKGEKLEGLLLAKKYGSVPMLVTIDVEVQASDLVAQEL